VDKLDELRRDVAKLMARVAQRPLSTRRGGGTSAELSLEIIGGYLLSGIDCVRYAASLTPTKVWNPEVDTASYDAGLGRAWLFINATRQPTRVLIRHDNSGHPRPLIAGARVRCVGTVTLTYSGTNFTAYTFGGF
jgi:hypothetical protein